ncbi:MAG TPA: extracellular solute-binding protein [Methylomirabilota bacterium]|jgi:ABC-type glycerol-3-phosphate transport system substrate-binding protein|nr:extracellular solute-binding protein [Methylomirabilota bacterium]HEV8673967.1 extracellular solute-binding protein [Methylomirabilota bacterium]
MRRITPLLAILAVVGLAPAVVLAQAKTTVTLWYPAGDITAGAAHFGDKDLWAEFEKKANVKVEAVALDYDTMQQKIFAAAAGRNIADILFIDTSWLPGFLKEEMLEPVADANAKAWLNAVSPEIKELSDYGNGRMWGYPQYGIDVYGLTWNKEHFKEAGLDPEKPPKTWAEFREYAKKLTKRDAQGNITRVGYAIRHVGHPHGVVHKHFWALYGAGARLVEDPNALRGSKALLNNEGGKAALKLVLDMLDVDKSTSLNFPDPRAAFLKGIASMQISETVSIKARQPKEAPELKWGMALPPVPKAGDKPVSLLGAWLYSVPKQAKNKALAWQAIEWINSANKDYELCKKYDASPRYKVNWDKEPFKSDPYDQGLKQLYPAGKKLPINLGLNGVMDAMGAAIQKVWHHEASVDAALAEAEQLANKAIADAAK